MKTDRPREVRDHSAEQLLLLSQEGARGPGQEPRPKGGRLDHSVHRAEAAAMGGGGLEWKQTAVSWSWQGTEIPSM